ncbi:2-(3-amino-3-carboxypropyl)histidine synthase subunit 1 [Jatropha curcas]|nr:2-(3-amino-3-carboxypropyl)histidine synthase subunit 1 [Jatropha curcas]
MKETRKGAIERAMEARNWGIVLGTLGRQGNPRILDRLEKKMKEKGFSYTIFLMSEISPVRIALFEDSVDAWIQIACPRLSIDWGEAFKKPLLTPFEAEIALGDLPGWWVAKSGCCGGCDCGRDNELCSGCTNADANDGDYPMDYYAQDGGDWNSSYLKKGIRPVRRNVASSISNGAAL